MSQQNEHSGIAVDGGQSLLSGINLPADLRRLDESQLVRLTEELREFLITSVSQTGGHLAAGLGVAELTVALHYVFNTPNDRLVWDVGHQAYPHKILTGRRREMATLRRQGGISGFPRREESEYDSFGTGHSSTSIGAALGMAAAAKQRGEGRHTIAVIGDGAMGGGMAFEALNQAGDLDLDLLVILNDNDMSISQPVGAFRNHLARALSGRLYTTVREGGKSALSNLPQLSDLVGRWEEHMKGMVMPGTLFEELGFNYIGPVDGHDMETLVATLKNMKKMSGPRLLHIVTQKGRGYQPAESDPCVYHGVTPFDLDTGVMNGKAACGPTYTQVFGGWLCDAAADDPRLVAITPAMCEGSGMVEFSRRFPGRYYDVGIAEQHAVTFAAGLACDGVKPVVAIYSSFLQRAYDQLIHDVALQNLDVTFAVDRAGQVGADGATHAGSFDLSFIRCIPNMVVMAPANELECRQMLQTAYLYNGPAMVRYPRGTGPGVAPGSELSVLPVGRGEICRHGSRVALLAFGSMLAVAEEAAESLDAGVANMRFIKPLDEALIIELANSYDLLVTLEENVVQGGAGSAVNECLAAIGHKVRTLNLGLPDHFIEHAAPQQQLAEAGLDLQGVINAVTQALEAE
ncbi:MAG: 1-deoxy-D-xylulose-5-phosphate synthase [Candidatus Sedimenticola sp. (ex Thyasira tokunagai)]